MPLLLPGLELILLRQGRCFAAPYQERAVRKQIGTDVGQRVGEDIDPPALFAGDPALQPQPRGVVDIPAEHQRMAARTFPGAGEAVRDMVDENPVEDAAQRGKRRLRAEQAVA